MAEAVWRRSESDRQIIYYQRRERYRDRSYAARLPNEPERESVAQPASDCAGLSDELSRRHAGDARESLPQSDGEAQTGRDNSTGASRVERRRVAFGGGISGSRGARRARRLVAGTGRERCASDIADAFRRGRAGAADRLRERDQSVAGAGDVALPRDRDPRRRRRQSFFADSTVADGERLAIARGGSGRMVARVMGRGITPLLESGRGAPFTQGQTGHHGFFLHSRRVSGGGRDLWIGSCVGRLQNRSGLGAQRRRARRIVRRWSQVAAPRVGSG